MNSFFNLIDKYKRDELSAFEFQKQGAQYFYRIGSLRQDEFQNLPFEKLAKEFDNLIEIVIFTEFEDNWKNAALKAVELFLRDLINSKEGSALFIMDQLGKPVLDSEHSESNLGY